MMNHYAPTPPEDSFRPSPTIAPSGNINGHAENGARIIGSGRSSSPGPGPELMLAETLTGNDVANTIGESVGDIKGIMLDVRTGRIAYAVLAVGGFLGIGEKLFAIPWSALTLDTHNKRFILDVSKERLAQAPGFDKDNWPSMSDMHWATNVHQFFHARPYWE